MDYAPTNGAHLLCANINGLASRASGAPAFCPFQAMFTNRTHILLLFRMYQAPTSGSGAAPTHGQRAIIAPGARAAAALAPQAKRVGNLLSSTLTHIE